MQSQRSNPIILHIFKDLGGKGENKKNKNKNKNRKGNVPEEKKMKEPKQNSKRKNQQAGIVDRPPY
jgi:hypothetical protein